MEKTKLNITKHQLDRIKERFDVFTIDDISIACKNQINNTLSLLNTFEFSSDKSFGVMLGEFIPNEKSKHIKIVGGNRHYYSIIDDSVISDSTGDQFWVVIRNNKITTFMLRKSIQTKDLAHNLEKLRVDEVIKNLMTYENK